MEGRSKEETSCPRYLSLRVHSSILLSTEAAEATISSQRENDVLLLPNDIVLGTTAELGANNTTKFEGKKNTLHDGPVCTREKQPGINHVFVMTEKRSEERTNNYNSSSNRFDYVTPINSPQRIVVQPPADKIKDLGRRARARTEQERQNRKGIKVIDDSTLVTEQIQRQGKKLGSLSKSIAKVSSYNTNSGKKRQRQQKQHNSQAQQQLHAAKISRKMAQLLWTPDLSQIHIPSEKDQSMYVQLHGLPFGSTFEIVRKFFTGLVPERIMLLQSNETYIWGLDVSYDTLPSYNLQDVVYTNNDVRVLVKFNSVSAARLAVDRSGETIFSKHLTTSVGSRQNYHGILGDLPDEFLIGVTHISKQMSSCLSKLSIDAIPGVPFHDCLFKVESKLNPMVRGILWSSTRRACHVSVDVEIKRCRILMEEDVREEGNTSNETNLLSFAGYQKHAKHHNRLLQIQEDLMGYFPIYNSEEATISMDPIVRLTAHACTVLEDEMDRIDIILYQYRALRIL